MKNMSNALSRLVVATLVAPALAVQAAGPLPPLSRDAPVETGVVRTADVHHILIADQTTAANLLREILSASKETRLARFKVIARRSSRDPSSAPIGGDLGTVFEGEMVRSFERPVLAAAPGDLIGPLKSEFGWHLAYITKSEEKPVAPICRSALEQAIPSPKTDDLAGVALAMTQADWSTLSSEIGRLLGNLWSVPLADQNGDLVFLQRSTVSEGAKVRSLVTRHVELRVGKFVAASRPMGCVRSIREQWIVDCKRGRIGGSFVYGYEGRAAAGRQLTATHYDLTEAELRPVKPQTFGSQIFDFGCDAASSTAKT
jgi:hypothetical protein